MAMLGFAGIPTNFTSDFAWAQTQTGKSAKELLKQMRDKNQSRLSSFKEELALLQNEVRKKNLKFKVAITEAMKKKLAEITGLKPPNEKKEKQRIKKREKQNQKIIKKIEKEKKLIPKGDVLPQILPKKIKPTFTCNPARKEFDWRKNKVVTQIKNQQTCGSCWTFTSASVIESAFLMKRMKKNKNAGKAENQLDISEQNLLDCSVYPHGRKSVGSCQGGWYGGVFEYLTNHNAALEYQAPYKNRKGKCFLKFKKKSQENIRTLTYGYVGDFPEAPSVKQIKKALCDFGPLASSVKVTKLFQAYSGGVFDEHAKVTAPNDVNHAITLVGWNEQKKSFLIKNSWGEKWGEKGYMWIEYGSNNIGYGTAWAVVP